MRIFYVDLFSLIFLCGREGEGGGTLRQFLHDIYFAYFCRAWDYDQEDTHGTLVSTQCAGVQTTTPAQNLTSTLWTQHCMYGKPRHAGIECVLLQLLLICDTLIYLGSAQYMATAGAMDVEEDEEEPDVLTEGTPARAPNAEMPGGSGAEPCDPAEFAEYG